MENYGLTITNNSIINFNDTMVNLFYNLKNNSDVLKKDDYEKFLDILYTKFYDKITETMVNIIKLSEDEEGPLFDGSTFTGEFKEICTYISTEMRWITNQMFGLTSMSNKDFRDILNNIRMFTQYFDSHAYRVLNMEDAYFCICVKNLSSVHPTLIFQVKNENKIIFLYETEYMDGTMDIIRRYLFLQLSYPHIPRLIDNVDELVCHFKND